MYEGAPPAQQSVPTHPLPLVSVLKSGVLEGQQRPKERLCLRRKEGARPND